MSYLEVIPTLSLVAGTVCSGPGGDPACSWHLINVGRTYAYEYDRVVSHALEKKKYKSADLPANAELEVCLPNKKGFEEMGTQSGEKPKASAESLSPNWAGPTKTRHPALSYLAQRGRMAWMWYLSILKRKHLLVIVQVNVYLHASWSVLTSRWKER